MNSRWPARIAENGKYESFGLVSIRSEHPICRLISVVLNSTDRSVREVSESLVLIATLSKP